MQAQGPPGAGGALMFVEKYRPSRIEELISHQDILSTCESLLAAAGCLSKSRPAVVFFWPLCRRVSPVSSLWQ